MIVTIPTALLALCTTGFLTGKAEGMPRGVDRVDDDPMVGTVDEDPMTGLSQNPDGPPFQFSIAGSVINVQKSKLNCPAGYFKENIVLNYAFGPTTAFGPLTTSDDNFTIVASNNPGNIPKDSVSQFISNFANTGVVGTVFGYCIGVSVAAQLGQCSYTLFFPNIGSLQVTGPFINLSGGAATNMVFGLTGKLTGAFGVDLIVTGQNVTMETDFIQLCIPKLNIVKKGSSNENGGEGSGYRN
ncbi:hypothetical protein HK104_006255 [Borealophlyctis nickersoniae]|nr:hypothetical protein HK104_006255 [Borealophlyctis nickersoniae]